MKITRFPEVRAAPNGIYFKLLYLFVLYNCAVSLHTEDTIQKTSLGDEPVAQRNFVFLNTSAFAPDCIYPHKSHPKTALKLRLRGFGITYQIICTPWAWMLYNRHLSGGKL